MKMGVDINQAFLVIHQPLVPGAFLLGNGIIFSAQIGWVVSERPLVAPYKDSNGRKAST